ncbi:HNH endonuclease [Bradyrhizobium sp. SZCCHNS3002]|uniref:HNH endonuclease n=1 Tax=Bradyrhizobium sp. SZCCHNS3002 TaxID=3057310 RepID=UPI0028EE7A19|nr:HNH endonuclease [Bradyrhizobium sp. SZCCHNS3002]
MDLLNEAGFEIGPWKNYKGNRPAANPKYCYNWSFEQPGEAVAVCLWHRSLKQGKGGVSFRRKPRGFAALRKGPGANVWNRRDADFGKNLELAYRQQLPIRVIVVDGEQRNPADLKPKASIVKARLLDPVGWAVTEYDYATGECLLERGKTPVLPAVDSSDLELAWFEGEKSKRAFIYHRRREAKARREKIQEALRANGGKLICEVQNCGFDFAERYGTLGEGYAQVHHLLPLSKSPKNGRETKLKDLAIVCANCHVMIHAGGKCRALDGLIAASKGRE